MFIGKRKDMDHLNEHERLVSLMSCIGTLQCDDTGDGCSCTWNRNALTPKVIRTSRLTFITIYSQLTVS